LVGVSDGINPGLECRNFFVQQGYGMNRVLLLQDNQSTIKMIQSGRSNSKKSRHIDIRFYFVCDSVKNGEVIVKHMNTKEMIVEL